MTSRGINHEGINYEGLTFRRRKFSWEGEGGTWEEGGGGDYYQGNSRTSKPNTSTF